jgi:hypothetical protein
MGGTGRNVGDGALIKVGAVVYGADAQVAEWVAAQIPGYQIASDTRALGVIKGNKLVAGVIYEGFTGFNVHAAISAIPGSGCADRRTLAALFAYPFLQLGVQAITVMVPMSNLESLNLATKLGFEAQAFIKFAARDGGPLVVLQQYRDKCRWISHGEIRGDAQGA